MIWIRDQTKHVLCFIYHFSLLRKGEVSLAQISKDSITTFYDHLEKRMSINGSIKVIVQCC